jgi:hypothetical protein
MEEADRLRLHPLGEIVKDIAYRIDGGRHFLHVADVGLA